MSAALSYSIAGLLPPDDPAAQEAALVAVSRACPGVIFHDSIGARPVRVADGEVTTLPSGERPPHLAQSITRDRRERFWLFEDHGDVLLAGWSPDDHEFEVELGGEGAPRLLGDLDQVAAEIEDALSDDELDEADGAFLRLVKEAIVIARTEQLPLVAHW